MNSLANKIETILRESILTRQDVLEISERAIQVYIDQREHEFGILESSEDVASVDSDSDGDYIDKEGNIYDAESKILIGKKNLKTKEKEMFNVL